MLLIKLDLYQWYYVFHLLDSFKCIGMDFSVTIVTKNRAKYLVYGLECLVGQTFPQKDFEVIIADNGSVDETKEVVDNFSKV